MSYRHLTEACFAARIGDGGLSGDAFAKTLADAAPALEGLRARHADGTLPILRLPALRDDLDALADVAKRLSERFDDVVVLGTGGSSLGGQALAALADAGYSRPRGTPRLHFIDNIDPHSIARLLAGLDLASSGFVAVSKSGATAETLTQCLVALDALRSAVGEAALAKHVTLITGPGASPLRRLGERYGFETLDHDPGVGGRFSVLSLVGLLPAMIAGLDAEAVRAGAARVLDATLAARQPRDSEPAVGAAIAVGLLREHGIATTVMMPYIDRLAPFALWYRQLWAESLGKNGAGTTPVHARGAVDQHSQLQLYLAGPRDKMFTLLTLDVAGAGARVPVEPTSTGVPPSAMCCWRRMEELVRVARKRRSVASSGASGPVSYYGSLSLISVTVAFRPSSTVLTAGSLSSSRRLVCRVCASAAGSDDSVSRPSSFFSAKTNWTCLPRQ